MIDVLALFVLLFGILYYHLWRSSDPKNIREKGRKVDE